jgi:hypothetical protein
MKARPDPRCWWRLGAAAALCLALTGCLEVKQHPAWVRGAYAGKADNQPYRVHFHNDKLAWNAALSDRTQHQNDYNRMKP